MYVILAKCFVRRKFPKLSRHAPDQGRMWDMMGAWTMSNAFETEAEAEKSCLTLNMEDFFGSSGHSKKYKTVYQVFRVENASKKVK
jgi:hypothetical protein